MKTSIEKELAPNTANATNNADNETAVTTKPKRKKRLPLKDDDFGDLCHTVNEQWKANPFFVLLNITQLEFEEMTTQFSDNLSALHKTTAKRRVLTHQLAHADKLMNKAMSQVKGYLNEKYETGVTPYYAIFGIEWYRKQYVFPRDRDKRKGCLELAKKAIVTEGFGNRKYGKKFWTDMHDHYSEVLLAANSYDGERSKRVSTKKLLKPKLTEVLNALILLLMANHGKRYRGQLRNWGFQKEKY